MKALVACERSGKVREALRKVGVDAISCDITPADDGSPHHHQGDVLAILDQGWDLMIAHPPCTYLSNSGAKHLYRGMNKENGVCFDRWGKMVDAAKFFRDLMEAPIPRICIENPIMHGHGKMLIGYQQTQTIQPWYFGHKEVKATCLWLKGLLGLRPSDNVGPPPKDPEEMKLWAKVHRMPPGPDRQRLRSETYQGIAEAIAVQWGTPETVHAKFRIDGALNHITFKPYTSP